MVFRGFSWLALILGAVAFDGKRCGSSVFHLVALAPREPLPRPACGERSTAEAERRRSGEGGPPRNEPWRVPLTRSLRSRPLPASGEVTEVASLFQHNAYHSPIRSVPAQLDFGGAAVLAWPLHAAVVERTRGMAREIGVLERAARQRAHVGAAGGDDGVDVAVADDAADGHCRDAELVADLIAEGRLEGAAVDRALRARHAAARHRQNVIAGVTEHAGDLDRVRDGGAALEPIDRGDARRDRLVCRPGGAHR